MIPLSVGTLAEVVGGQLTGPDPDPTPLITAVTVDSRTAGPGSLFAALPGEHVDGHRFVPAAAAQGAVAALVSQAVPGAPGCCVQVPDVLAALGRLTRHLVDVAAAAGAQVIAITGSQGKTSTKDLLATVLEGSGPTVAPYGNLNNELGVPLTVARLEPDTRFLVAEFGARGVGHIRYLTEIAPPRIGVVLNVGTAHLGEFGSREAIAQAKGELVEALPADGVAVLNADDPLVWAMRARTAAAVLPWSAQRDPGGVDAVWATQVRLDAWGRPSFVLHARHRDRSEAPVEVQLPLTGRHQVGNAVAATAASLAAGLELPAIAPALAAARPRSRWRMELRERSDGVLVLNDSYNANPESMRAALHTLVDLAASRPGRTWAVLGDMLELGETAAAEHAALGRSVAELGVDHVLVTGAYAATVVAAAGDHGTEAVACATSAELVERLEAGVRGGDVVLIKASRGLALDTVAELLLAAPAHPTQP